MVESQPSKLLVASSILVSRSKISLRQRRHPPRILTAEASDVIL
jgi:hypothetical protein